MEDLELILTQIQDYFEINYFETIRDIYAQDIPAVTPIALAPPIISFVCLLMYLNLFI
jgi:hypothetical protein